MPGGISLESLCVRHHWDARGKSLSKEIPEVMPVFLKKKKCKFLNFSKRKASSYEPHKTDGDAAAADDDPTIEGYVRIPVPENASIEERLAIFQKNNAANNERMEKALAEERRRLHELSISLQKLEVSSRQTQGYWQDMYKQSQENHEQFVNVVATQHKHTSPEFATLRKEIVSEIELPIGGNQSKGLTGESQPYTEVVHGEVGPRDCSSDKKIVTRQIYNFSTNQAKYVATDQMHGGQDAPQVHPLTNQKQMHDQFNYDFATGHHHDHAKGLEHDPLNYQLRHGPPFYHQSSLGLATGRHGEGDGQFNYQLSFGLKKPICGFINQFNLKFFMYASRPSGGFDICGRHICNPPCKNGQNNYSSGQFVLRDCKFEYHQYKLTLVYSYSNFLQKGFVYDTIQSIEASQYDAWKENRGKQIFDMPIFEEEIDSSNFGDSEYDLDAEPIYDEYDDNYNLIIGSKNHMQEFKFFEALDMEDSDQPVVKYKSQCVANSEDTMFYDMVVGDKADLGTPSSPKLRLKIMFRQPTKILGGIITPPTSQIASKFSTRNIFVVFLQTLTRGIFVLKILIHQNLE